MIRVIKPILNEEYKKVNKSEKIQFKNKNLKTLREE